MGLTQSNLCENGLAIEHSDSGKNNSNRFAIRIANRNVLLAKHIPKVVVVVITVAAVVVEIALIKLQTSVIRFPLAIRENVVVGC